jgi:peptidoglycan hydrolase-like protein with peptidoglycan-binding domain
MIPDGPYLALIQWTFDTPEEGYGPATRAAVADLQHQYGIPVDADVMVGPRSWTRILEAYQRKVLAVTPWTVPADPYRLDGDRPEEAYLRNAIDRLNGQLVPDAAACYLRNKRIAAMQEAGIPPAAEVAVPPSDDPEVAAAVAQLTWNQSKIDRLWAQACAVGVDPRVMLACLFQEGTGSFDTNAAVPTQFWNGARYLAGGSGVQPDFEQDLAAAMEHHILAKVRAYGYYAAAFQEAVLANGLGDGNVFQYVNWVVPWVKAAGWSLRPGCYATHTEWWRGLQRYFDGLAGEGATQAYSAHLTGHPAPVSSPAPAVRFVLTYNGTGPTDYDVNHPWIEAFEG